ncbi:Ig-like domain-containing protein [Spirosoma flavum]|uniref:T9SS type A sorting domain-containing protein n=1 Tax=Spirosoma flavum TaxID=2048557 RepID=A0ABW6ALC6_9BACT
MTLHVRSLMWVLVVLLAYCGTAQAQQVNVTSVTPNPICAGATITATYSYTLPDPGTVVLYLNGPNTTNLPIGAAATNGNNGSVSGTIPADRATGSYTVFIRRTSNILPNPINSPASSAFTVNAQPAAPVVSPLAYCLGTTGVPPLTATGQNLKWYTVSTGGTGSTTAPTPPTSVTGTTNNYVSQTNTNGCEGPRATLAVTIRPLPDKPTVVSSLSYCQSTNPPSLAASVTSGSNLKWYASVSGGVGSSVAPTPQTSTVTTTTYYVTQTNSNGCESDRAAITVTIKATPAPPTVTTPVTYCQDQTATPLSATSVSGGTLNWFGPSNNSLGSTAPTPPTNAPGTTFYSVSQTVGGCTSTAAPITVTVNAKPPAPTTKPVGVCQNTAPVSLATGVTSGTNLRWYTVPTNGTASTVAPTPSTGGTGSTPYYVSQVNSNGCESGRAVITYTVYAYPSAPTVSPTSLTYCQSSPAVPLTATGVPNATLNYYTVATGGTSSLTLTPSTSQSNNYYVSQTLNGCESQQRATIGVVINALPASPAVTTPVAYCQLTVAAPLSATASTNNTLNWYGTAATGGTASTVVPTPPTTTDGAFPYYVSQKDPFGCESPRAQISVTIYPKPSAPTIPVQPSACLNSVPAPLAQSVTATGTLKWYTASTGGIGSTVAPTLSTSAVGSPITYYVSQTNISGCESDRAPITFTVNPLPAAPVPTPTTLLYCQNATAQPLTATGQNLKWYSVLSGGTPLATPLTPSTSQATPITYYVSQTNANGCESPRASVTVTTVSRPVAPTVSATPVVYCQFDTPVSLSATAITGNALSWYGTSETGGTASTGSGFTVPTTDPPGSTRYYVSQTDGNGCESSTRAFITVKVNAKPAVPNTTSLTLCLNASTVSLATAVTSGSNLKWYTAQTGGTMYAVTPVLSTSAVGPTTYYVSQTSVDGCESDRSAVLVTVKSLPVAPTITFNTQNLCQSSVPTALTAIATGTLKWYDTASQTYTSITPSTNAVGPTSYSVSQTVDGCEGPKATLTVVVIPKPVMPTVVGSIAVCQLSTPTTLTATGQNLKWYDTGGALLATAPTPPTSASGTTVYYVTQTDANGCESDRASISVRVKPKPAAPGTAAISVCSNQVTALTATFAVGTSPNWYGTNATSTSTAPTPATNVIGAAVNYFVSQTLEGCESEKASIAVTIKALPVAPTVSSDPVVYCQGITATALSATATGSLSWYATQTGGAASANAPIPQTTVSIPPTTYYYVSQTVNGCEGPRASIAVTINPKPAKPTVVSSFTYCQNTTATILSATAPGTLKWYTDTTSTTVIPTPTPVTNIPGVTTYYVSQTDGKGCESYRATITVTVIATPVAPTTAPISVCQNSVVVLTATPTTGGILKWYTARTGGVSTAVAPTPPTSTTGTIKYFVSQSINGCEGPRDSIVVTIIPLPTAPIVSITSFSLCQNSTPTALTASASGTLNWYTTSGGTPTSVAPIPSTSTVGTFTYYVSQSVNGCEGPRTAISVIIAPLPTSPTVSLNTISLCQNSVPTALTATASVGGTLNWYTVSTGGVSTAIAPTPSTSAANTTTYYVSQTLNGCEGPRTSITVTITPLPVVPGISAINLCQNSTPTALTATVSPGGTLNWYTVSTGGTASSIAPTPPTSTVGATTYYVSQSVNGCEGPRTTMTVNILPLPAAPVVSTNTVSICQNSDPITLTATVLPGGTLNWYTVPTGGTPTSVEPIPPTSTVTTLTYYVSQSVNGCEGPRTTITVTIKPLPTAPTVSTAPLTYCQGITAGALTATQTSGGILNWYGTNPGGIPSPVAPVPSTTTPGVSTYYVSQTVNGCEGPQAAIVVLIQATPADPTVGATPIYCQGGTATALSAIASPGGSLNWYTVQVGGIASSTPPVPPVTTSGTITYYVSQSVNNCEGPRVSLTATIRAAPGAPAVIPTLAYCLGYPAIPLTATPAGGGTLNWYANPTGGSASSVAPIPPTTTAGTILYYVSQTDATGCESTRTSISVKVNPLPDAPTTTPVSVCQNAASPLLASAVSATGSLNWYTAQTGGTPSSVAPVPVTTTAGVLTYYVSQNDVNGCESNRSLLLVTITPLPAAPAVAAIAPVCQNSTPIVLAAAGQSLKWYTDATSTASLGSSIIQPTTQAGTFAYYVSQTVNLCESPRALAQIVVNALPAAPTVVAVQNSCQDALAQPLTAIGTALQWYDANDNLISPPTPVTKVDVTQTYSYKVTQTLNECTSLKAALTYIVNVTPPPTVVSLAAYCQNETAKPLQATGTNLQWIDPAGAITTVAPTPNTTIVTAGASYSVTQTSLLGCESRKAEIKVVVNALSVAKLEGTAAISLGSSAVLSLTLTGTGPYTYTLSDGTTGTAESTANSETTVKKITVTPGASTTYTVTAISNACGAGIATGAAVVSVKVPTIATAALSTSTVCTGASLTVPFTTSGEFTLGNAFTVEIASADVDSAARKYIPISNGVIQGPTIVTAIPGTIASGQYYIRVSASNTSFPISGTRSPTLLTVRAAPTAAFIASKKNIYKGEPAELFFTLSGDSPWTVTYAAGLETRSIASTTNLYSATVTPATTTTYKLTSVANICGLGKIEGADTTTIRVDILLAEADPFINSVKVYPVPTDGTVTIDIDVPLQKEPAQLQLISFDGHIREQLTTRQRQTTLYLDKELAGTYLLYIKIGNQSTVRKIIKR